MMTFRNVLQLLLGRSGRQLINAPIINRTCSSSAYHDRDPAPYFFNENVQLSLRKLTGLDYEKIFQAKKPGRSFKKPRYKFLTKEMLQRELSEIEMKADELLQMPPVLSARKQIQHTFVSNAGLTGYDESKFIFTDTSVGVKDKDRLIVVRDLNGVLRKAYWEERERCLNIYFPTEGKELTPPKMFSGEYLQNLLEQGKYEFVLNRACLQYEPDDAEYLRVTHETYEYVDSVSDYDTLWSTRHYGPLVFYLTWVKKLDSLLLHLLKHQRIRDVAELIRLYCYLHKESQQITVEEYVGSESSTEARPKLELALQQAEGFARSAEVNET